MRSYRPILASVLGVVVLAALAVVGLRQAPPAGGGRTAVAAPADSAEGGSAPRADRQPADAPSAAASPTESQEVGVRWAPGVDDATRRALETKYQLTQAKFDPGDPRRRTWLYRLTNVTPANRGALLADPAVEDTAHISRP